MSVAILAALPREIAGLSSGHVPDPVLRKKGISLYRLGEAVAVAGGMGSERVTLAVEAALSATKVTTLISVGLAGSCDPQIQAGTLHKASVVIDARSGERYETTDADQVVLVSTDEIASAREKKRFRESYGAAMVDMEAATVARLARANGLNFQAWKGISDAHNLEIESLARFTDRNGQFQTLRFAAYTAARPHTWKTAIELGRNSNAALRHLNQALLVRINTP